VKTRGMILCAVVTLAVALVASISLPAASNRAPANAVPVAAAGQPNTPAASPAPEPHPEIRAAIGSLRRAKDHLEHAAHDFGGHRVDAIRAIDAAIEQLQTCLRYDK